VAAVCTLCQLPS